MPSFKNQIFCLIVSIFIIFVHLPVIAAPATISLDSSTQISYILLDPKTNVILDKQNPNKALIPASTTKLLTVGWALRRLGRNYRFKTQLLESNQTITLVGGEDPDLRIPDLVSLVNDLHRLDIKPTKFLYVTDATIDKAQIDVSMSQEAAYNPSLSSLSLESNQLSLFWRPNNNELFSNGKKQIHAYFVPSLPNLNITLLTEHSTSNDERDLLYDNVNNVWKLRHPKQSTGVRPIPAKDAALFTALTFRELAKVKGINLPEPIPTSVKTGNQISVHLSRPLSEIAQIVLAKSDNTMTELILLHVAKSISNHSVDLKTAATMLQESYQASISNVNWSDFHLINGSGLTTENRISSEQLAAALIFNDNKIKDGIENFLPMSGATYGLLNRLNKPNQAFRVIAKTGGIHYSSSLTGFLYTQSGRRLAFAIIITDFAKRNQLDQATDRYSQKQHYSAYQWTQKSIDAIDEIVTNWLDTF